MSNTKVKISRSSNIELLRIICALSVVVLHFNNNGIGKGFEFTNAIPFNHQLLIILECFTICAVDTFVIISGYYSVEKKSLKISKAIKLIALTIVLQLTAYAMRVVGGATPTEKGIFNCFVITNYYVCLFVALQFLMPYINVVFQNITNGGAIKFLILLILVFSVYPFLTDAYEKYIGINYSGFSSISMDGSGRGYTIVNFVICYCVGGLLEKVRGDSRYSFASRSSMLYGVLFVVCTLLIYAMARYNSSLAWEYCNPIVIASATFLFLTFINLKIGSYKVINRLASASFPCFLLHQTIFRWINISYICSQRARVMLIMLAGVCFGCYIIAFVVSEIIEIACAPLWKAINKLQFEIIP